MENTRVVYVNTFAEGAHMNEQTLSEENMHLAVRGWQRAKTVIHLKLLGIEGKSVDGVRREYLFGDLNVAKVILPVEEEYSGLLPRQDPMELLDYWVCVMVEQHDFQDEGQPVIVVNRTKGLARLQEINRDRIHQVEGQAYGVIQGVRRGAYILNVGGFTALMPRAWYDWNQDLQARGAVGEEFPVQIRPTKVTDRIVVSRCHLLPNPNTPTTIHIERGSKVRATVAFIHNGLLKAEVSPGFRVSVDPVNMRSVPKVGDRVTVRILGQNHGGYYGIMV